MTEGWHVAKIVEDIGGWVGLVGGLAGLYAFAANLWRRRIRISVDYTRNNDAHRSWHRFTITNLSDLPVTFRYIGPAWFMSTWLLPVQLNFATEMDDHDPPLTTLAPRASTYWDLDGDFWEGARPGKIREKAYLKIGVEVPMTGTVNWVKPRSAKNWDMSIREHWIHKLYGLYDTRP